MPESTAERGTSEPPRERRVLSLSPGAGVALTLAALCLVGAGFLLFMGIEKVSDTGFPFLCGTAIDRPASQLAQAGCGYLNQNQLLKAGWLAASGLVIAIGGVATFGVRVSSQPTPDPGPRGLDGLPGD